MKKMKMKILLFALLISSIEAQENPTVEKAKETASEVNKLKETNTNEMLKGCKLKLVNVISDKLYQINITPEKGYDCGLTAKGGTFIEIPQKGLNLYVDLEEQSGVELRIVADGSPEAKKVLFDQAYWKKFVVNNQK